MGSPHEPMSRPKSRGAMIGQMTKSSSTFKMTRTISQITVWCPPLKIGHAFGHIKLAAVWSSRWRQGGLRSSSRQPRKSAATVVKPRGSTGQVSSRSVPGAIDARVSSAALITRKQKDGSEGDCRRGSFRQERRNELTCLMTLENPTPVPDNGNLHRFRVPCFSSHSPARHTLAPAPSINMPKPRHLRRRSPITLPLDNLFPLGDALWNSGLTHRFIDWPPSETEARLRIVRP